MDDIIDTAKQNTLFTISNSQNFYGDNKLIISCNENYQPNVSVEEKKIMDFVIEKTKSMYFNEFIDYVYSTYPISSQQRYLNLDLISLANEYNSILKTEKRLWHELKPPLIH